MMIMLSIVLKANVTPFLLEGTFMASTFCTWTRVFDALMT